MSSSNRLEAQWEPSIIPPVTTGPDGTFRIDGIGRERVATLQFEGPTIETKRAEVRTRPGETIRVPGWKGFANANLITIYGANFEHVAGPTRPIEGVVRDQDTGRPLAGVMVRGERSLSDSASATSIRSAMHKAGIAWSACPGARKGPLSLCHRAISRLMAPAMPT